MSYINKNTIISPSQITSDQNNYNPTNFGLANVVRLSGDSSFRAITSMLAGNAGDEKFLINVGSYPIYFPSDHPSGTAANRFDGTQDNILLPNEVLKIIYDGTLSRWRIICDNSLHKLNGSRNIYYRVPASSPTAGDQNLIGFSTSGGAVLVTNSSTSVPGAFAVGTSTSATGAAAIYFAKTPLYIVNTGNAHIYTSAFVYFPTLSDGTNTYTAYLQLSPNNAASTANANNTIGIRYSNGVNSGKFEGYSKNNSGTESTVDLGTTVATNTLYLLRIEVNYSLTEVRFYLDGVYVGRVTSNLPATATPVCARCLIVKSAGTTNRDFNVAQFEAGAHIP